MIRKIISGLIVLFLTSCGLNDNELKESWWKFRDGYHIGDVLDFNNKNLIVKNDTLFIENIPKGVIISKTKSFFSLNPRRIILKSLDSNDKGIYIQK